MVRGPEGKSSQEDTAQAERIRQQRHALQLHHFESIGLPWVVSGGLSSNTGFKTRTYYANHFRKLPSVRMPLNIQPPWFAIEEGFTIAKSEDKTVWWIEAEINLSEYGFKRVDDTPALAPKPKGRKKK